MTNQGKKIKTVAIIQARIASTRLPEKALIKLSGITMIGHVIERVKLIKGVDHIILATGTNIKNEPLIKISDLHSIDSFRGSEHDVLSRFHSAIENQDFNYIIRITGDNPFTDFTSASQALIFAIDKSADHCSIKNIPLGTGVEIISRSAIERCFHEGNMAYHREHVTPYIKENPTLFKIEKYYSTLRNPFPKLRLTVDTNKDLELVSILYKNIYKGIPIPLEEVIEYIEKNPKLVELNSNVQQRPMTHSSNA